MARFNNISSIRTLWENNPDTAISAANLSRLQDFTASYLNSDLSENNPHVESSILFLDPNDDTQIIIKRGTIIQIINESVDSSNNRIVPINEMYKIFDIGLEDVILTVNDTDDTKSIKSMWESPETTWNVFMCDKDDSAQMVKATDDDDGGGAQILISKNNDFPIGEIPGRLEYSYSAGDTRLIGGFKTLNDKIVQDSVWDIAGKFQTVKAKVYKILDEYEGTYRKINITDVDTTGVSTFENNIIVGGNIFSDSLITGDIVGDNTTLTGIFNQEGPAVVDGSFTVESMTTLNSSLDVAGVSDFKDDVSITGDVNINDIFAIGTEVVIDTKQINNGDIEIDGDVTHLGSLSQTGDVKLGSESYISAVKRTTMYGDVSINDNIIFDKSNSTIDIQSPVDDNSLIFINQDTGSLTTNLITDMVITNDVIINGTLNLSAGTSDIGLHSNGNINTSATLFDHLGSMTVVGGDVDFTVKSSDTNTIMNVSTVDNKITTLGSFETTLNGGDTFTVRAEDSTAILAIEDLVDATHEKHVQINSSVVVSSTGTAENALYVNGNSSITGELKVNDMVIDGDGISGNAATSSKLAVARTIALAGDVTGSITFDGSSNEIMTTAIVDDSHRHDNDYYTKTELSENSSAVVSWGNISNMPSTLPSSPHTHDEYLLPTEITWSLLEDQLLVETGLDDIGDMQLASINHLHDNKYVKLGTINTDDVTFVPGVDVPSWATSSEAINELYSRMEGYLPADDTSIDIHYHNIVAGGTIEGQDIVSSGEITSVLSRVGNSQRIGLDKAGLLFAGSTDYQLWSSSGTLKVTPYNAGTDTEIINETKTLLYSMDGGNVPDTAKALDSSINITINAGTGLGGGGVIAFDGSTGITFDLNTDFEEASTVVGLSEKAARLDHQHKLADIYSESGETIDLVLLPTSNIIGTGENISLDNHTHDITTTNSEFISDNAELISDNAGLISNNSGLILTNTNNIETNAADLKNASNITSGTLSEARVGVLPASKVTSGVFDIARIPTGDDDTSVALGGHTHDYQEKESGGFVYAKLYMSGRPAVPIAGDIHFSGTTMEIYDGGDWVIFTGSY